MCSNLLLNIGPMADGTIDPVFEERLLEMGAWLNVSYYCNIVILTHGLYRLVVRQSMIVFHGSIKMTLLTKTSGTQLVK